MDSTIKRDVCDTILEINKNTRIQNPLISCVVPCYNEAKNLKNLCLEVDAIFKKIGVSYELIIINDGSKDDTFFVAYELIRTYPIKLIHLSRNYGKEIALTAGIDNAYGDITVMLDADLQHPPIFIEDFYHHWQKGYDMIYGYRSCRNDETLFKRLFTKFFYGLINFGQSRKIIPNILDFRMMDKKVINALQAMPENNRFMKGLYSWIGFTNIGIPVRIPERTAGITSFGFMSLFKLAITGLTSFSNIPLRLWGFLGAIMSILSLMYGVWILFATLIWGNPTPGWPTVIVFQSFFGGILLMSIGIIGEYIGRIFTEVKRRPLYFISNIIQSNEINR